MTATKTAWAVLWRLLALSRTANFQASLQSHSVMVMNGQWKTSSVDLAQPVKYCYGPSRGR